MTRQRACRILIWAVLGALDAAVMALGPDALSCTAECVGFVPSPR